MCYWCENGWKSRSWGKAIFNDTGTLFLFYIGLGSYIILAAKTTPTTIGALILYIKLLSLMVSLVSINLPWGLAWNTSVKSAVVLLATTWIWRISNRNGCAGLLVQYLLLLLNTWLTSQMWPVKVFSIGITLVDIHLNWLSWFRFFIFVGGPFFILTVCIVFLSLRYYRKVYANSLFSWKVNF